jgi:hypothetical protein
MRKPLLGTGTAIVAAITGFCQPSFAFTQAECDQLKKVQTDGSGREIKVKMQVDAQGNCNPEPLNSPKVKAPVGDPSKSAAQQTKPTKQP